MSAATHATGRHGGATTRVERDASPGGRGGKPPPPQRIALNIGLARFAVVGVRNCAKS